MGKTKSKVIVSRRNFDTWFFRDIMEGNGFIISDPPEITMDGEKKKTLYGPRSPLYGTTYEDEQSYIERYRCKCGAFKSRLFEGEVCPICGEKVEDRGLDLSITGWIVLDDNSIINPYYYKKFELILGKTKKQIFSDMIYARYKVDTNGIVSRVKEGDIDGPLSSPFYGIGVRGFYDNFEDIIDYFIKLKKDKADSLEQIRREKRNVFCSHIPIMTTFIRPQSASGDTLYYNTIDKSINTLFTLKEQLKSCEELDKEYILQRIQNKANNIWEIGFSILNGKEGLIRGEILGGSLNYTSRSVIVPDPSLRDNEIDVSYHAFLELYRYKIIYYLMKIQDITLGKAYNIWKAATKFDPVVYNTMKFIVDYAKTKVVLNRNPTLNYYSILLLNIRNISSDEEDYTYSLPLSILPGLNADFDGDTLNMVGMVTKEIAYMYRKFDPIRRMIISKDTGFLNPYFSITKNQLIDLYYFATLGSTPNDQKEVFD